MDYEERLNNESKTKVSCPLKGSIMNRTQKTIFFFNTIHFTRKLGCKLQFKNENIISENKIIRCCKY